MNLRKRKAPVDYYGRQKRKNKTENEKTFESNRKCISLLNLPTEVILKVASHLPDINTLINWKLTCKKLKNVVDSNKVKAGALPRRQISSLSLSYEAPYIRCTWNVKRNCRVAKTKTWNPNDLNEISLAVLTRHLSVGRLDFRGNVFVHEKFMEEIMRSQMDLTKPCIVEFLPGELIPQTGSAIEQKAVVEQRLADFATKFEIERLNIFPDTHTIAVDKYWMEILNDHFLLQFDKLSSIDCVVDTLSCSTGAFKLSAEALLPLLDHGLTNNFAICGRPTQITLDGLKTLIQKYLDKDLAEGETAESYWTLCLKEGINPALILPSLSRIPGYQQTISGIKNANFVSVKNPHTTLQIYLFD